MSNVRRRMEKWQVYVQEAQTQLAFARDCFSKFQGALADGNTHQVFLELHHFIVHAANVDKLLHPKPGSPRQSLLFGHVDLQGIDLKPLRRLRNHLEHFDERLDQWIADHHGQTFFDMNIITGAKGFPSKAFLRALDGNVFKFYGEDFPLTPLYQSVEELHARLKRSDA